MDDPFKEFGGTATATQEPSPIPPPAAPAPVSTAAPDDPFKQFGGQVLPTPIASSVVTPKPASTEDPFKAFGGSAIEPVAADNDGSAHSILSGLSQMVSGPGTMGGIAKTSPQTDIAHEPWSDTWKKLKIQGHDFLDTSLIVPSNSFDPAYMAAHPKEAAAARGVSDAIKGLTTPGNLALILATGGLEALPAVLEEGVAAAGASALTAARAAKVAKTALQGAGVFFTADQLARTIEAFPEVGQAFMTGQTDKAIYLTTSAMVNGVVAGAAGINTFKSIHGTVNPEVETGAMKHKDYNDLVHSDVAFTNKIGGQIHEIANRGLNDVPDIRDREWGSEYGEAGRNRKLMGERQAETVKGPTPTEQIEATQRGALPFGEEKQPITVYRGGIEGEAGRFGSTFYAEDPKYAANYTSEPGRSLIKKQIIPKNPLDISKPEDALKIAQAMVKGSSLSKEDPEALANYIQQNGLSHIESLTAHILKEQGHDFITQPNDWPASASSTGRIWLDLGAKTSDSPAEVSIPKGMEGEAANKYAQEKLQLQKDFAAARVPKAEPTQEDLNSPAAQKALELKAAIHDYEEAAKNHVATPMERATMAEQQDPTRELSQKKLDAIHWILDRLKDTGKLAQSEGVLDQNQLRSNFVPHELNFDDRTDPTRARLYDTMHDLQQAGHVLSNKDLFALAADYQGKMGDKIRNTRLVRGLKSGTTNDGAPLALPGGFVEGQRVSAEGPQGHTLSDLEVKKFTNNGQLPRLIKNGDVVPDVIDGKTTFRVNPEKYVKADNLFEERPIGPTPIPKTVTNAMEVDGSLKKLEDRGLVYKDDKGNYFNKQELYARTPIYLHKDIADHFNTAVKPKTVEPTSFIGKMGKMYDDTTGNMKSLLLAWSPFHRATISARMMESMGILKGGILAAKANLGFADPIDYFNLKPIQEAAIRDGIMTGGTRGQAYAEEGLSAGEHTWGAKSYKAINWAADKALKTLGVPPEIRNKVPSLQKIFTDNVFGPQGLITDAKFGVYADKKPQILKAMKKDHPDWSPQELDKQAGRMAARFANNLFGGLNYEVLGRAAADQKFWRRVLLAPDFLESTGRSIVDLASPYGSSLVAKLIQFNIAHALLTAGVNYAIHHDPNDKSVDDAVKSSHILDHPFSIVSPDEKSLYGIRTRITDFEHLVNKPKEFAWNRLNPFLKASSEVATQRNEYGRKESLLEATKAFPKAALPLATQGPLGLGPNVSTEPTNLQQFMKSIGIQARPNRSNAEDLALNRISEKLQGQAARTGQDLIHQQLKLHAEDNLRDALQAKDKAMKAAKLDPTKVVDTDKIQTDIKAATQAIDTLTRNKQLTSEEQKKVVLDAKGSRLASLFHSLDSGDALDVWDKMSDDEKRDKTIDMYMHEKYVNWRHKLIHNDGKTLQTMEPEDHDMFNRLRKAATEADEIRNRPEPPPLKPKPAQAAAK